MVINYIMTSCHYLTFSALPNYCFGQHNFLLKKLLFSFTLSLQSILFQIMGESWKGLCITHSLVSIYSLGKIYHAC